MVHVTIRYRILRHLRDRCLLPVRDYAIRAWSDRRPYGPQPWHSEAANG